MSVRCSLAKEMRRGTDFTKYLVEVLSVLMRGFGTALARTRPNKRCSRQNIVGIHGLGHQGKNSHEIVRTISQNSPQEPLFHHMRLRIRSLMGSAQLVIMELLWPNLLRRRGCLYSIRAP